MRAFVVGVTLLVLLFGGFVVGVEAGTHPLEQAAATSVATGQASVHTVTVQSPVVRTVVNGHTRFVRLSSVTTRVVLIRKDGKTVIAYQQAPETTASTGPESAAPPTLYTLPPETVTVTSPPETVTEPPVTVTVTEPGTTDTSGTSGSSTSP